MIASAELTNSALLWSLVASTVLIVLNGIFVAYEFALIAARRSLFEEAAKSGKRTGRLATRAMADLSIQLAGAQLGITMASLALGRVGEPAVAGLFEKLFESVAPWMPTAASFVIGLSIVVFLHLVIGEMVPKNLALAAPEPTLRALVIIYSGYLIVFRPFVRFLNLLANWGTKAFGFEPKDELVAVHSATELASIVSHSSAEGAIEADSARLLHGALAFSQRPIGEIAIPLDELVTIPLGATAAQAERAAAQTVQQRIPIVGSKEPKTLIGYVHASDLLLVDESERFTPLPSGLVRQMALVRADRSLIDVLRTLRRVHRQLAVVVDGDGPIGVVSVDEVIGALALGPISE